MKTTVLIAGLRPARISHSRQSCQDSTTPGVQTTTLERATQIATAHGKAKQSALEQRWKAWRDIQNKGQIQKANEEIRRVQFNEEKCQI